jgi:uncharacterized OB-fold protein
MSHQAGRVVMPIVVDTGERPDPLIHPDTEPFWTALDRGELVAQVCGSCGTWRFPFGPVCFRCRSFDHAWEALDPAGTVAAVVVVQRATGERVWAEHVPFLSGTVDMAHGLRLPGRVLCTCGAARQHGTAVRAVRLVADGHPTVMAFAHRCVAQQPEDAG